MSVEKQWMCGCHSICVQPDSLSLSPEPAGHVGLLQQLLLSILYSVHSLYIRAGQYGKSNIMITFPVLTDINNNNKPIIITILAMKNKL